MQGSTVFDIKILSARMTSPGIKLSGKAHFQISQICTVSTIKETLRFTQVLCCFALLLNYSWYSYCSTFEYAAKDDTFGRHFQIKTLKARH